MPHKQGLVPASVFLPDLPKRSQALGHSAVCRNGRTFTLSDQVSALVKASEATPDRGFLGRTMALCSLPRSNPGNQIRYITRCCINRFGTSACLRWARVPA